MELVRTFSADELVLSYHQSLGIDVTRYFESARTVSLFRCASSGLRFFDPPTIAGDGDLYSALERRRNYYREDKWEHRVAIEEMCGSGPVLEVGCGRGAFLERLRGAGIEGVGLEINGVAALCAKGRGLDVRTESIFNHAQGRSAQYGAVCMFQVLEHMTDVGGVLRCALDLLRADGLLVIGVPNSAVSNPVLEGDTLNMPPHHMSHWDVVSLANLCHLYPVRLEVLRFQPMPAWCALRYGELVRRHFAATRGVMGRLIGRVAWRVIRKTILSLADHLPGHTVMACYRKVGV